MPVYPVSQVCKYLKDILGQDVILQDIWVRGEVANLARPGSGHSYFSLRDSTARLRCAMFRGGFGSELLSDGTAIIAHGRVSVYEVRGDLQLIVDMVQPEGVGELQLRFEKLKLKLQDEGLFEQSRKRPIPEHPRRIGVVTSSSGAVWHDIQTIVRRRYPLVELLLSPAAVQGEGAAQTIIEALDVLAQQPSVDLIILARGGGSLEDLWPFNEEMVARAIFSSRIPVISGVGHETDVTIADMVADQRAPTPSAAAEMAVPDKTELLSVLLALQQTLTTSVSERLREDLIVLRNLQPRLRMVRPDLDDLRQCVDDLLKNAMNHLRRDIEIRIERTNGFGKRLGSLSPVNTLRRGYAIVHSQVDGVVISDSDQVAVGDQTQITLARGGFGAKVASVQNDDGRP